MLGQVREQRVALARWRRRITVPRSRSVWMLGGRCTCITKGIARLLRPPPPPKDAAHAVGRIGEGVLEPAVKRAVHEIARLVFGGNLEKRINSCLDRAL